MCSFRAGSRPACSLISAWPRHIIALALILIACAPHRLLSAPVIGTIRDARRHQPSAPREVQLRGVVTGFSGWNTSFFLEDSSGAAISVDRREITPVQPGDEIEVSGVVNDGLYAPVIESDRIRVIGHRGLPPPKIADFDALAQPSSDSSYVQTTGIVHAVHAGEVWGKRVLYLDLFLPGGQITIYLQNFPNDGLPDFVDSTIQVSGVCGTVFNRRHMAGLRLFVSDLSHIRVLQKGLAFEALPLSPANTLGRFDGPALNHRIKVSGSVTYQDAENAFYLQDGDTAVHVQTAAAGKWRPGSRVVVAGFFTASGYLPVISAAGVETAGPNAPVQPLPVTAGQILQTADGFLQAPYTGRLIRLDARVVDLLPAGEGRVWQLQSGPVKFTAQLPGSPNPGSVGFESDTEVELNGICLLDEVTPTTPRSFRVLLRSPEDIWTLRTPHWSSSLLLLIVLVGLVLAGALVLWFLEHRRNRRAGGIRQATGAAVGISELRIIAIVIAIIGICAGLEIIIGWTCDIPVLELRDPQRHIVPNAALGILFGAVSLLFAYRRGRFASALRWISASFCAVIGAFSLLENALSLEFTSFDRFLIRNVQTLAGSLAPGRMATATAICLLLVAPSLVIDPKKKRTLGFGQVLALACAVIALLNLIANLFGSAARFGAGAHATMAIPTAVAMTLLAVAALFSSSAGGFMATIQSSGIGGLMARRMIPVAFLLPVVLGWIRLEGQLAGYYDTRFGLALLVLTSIVCFGFLIWNSAAILNDIDSARSQAEEQVRERDERLEAILQTAQVGDWSWNVERDEVTAHPVVWALYGAAGHLGPEPASWFQQRQHPEDAAMIESELATALREGKAFDLEFRVVRPNGSIRWICCRGTSAHDASGKWIENSGINFDITDRKIAELRLRETEERFRQLAEAMPQIVWTADAGGVIEYYNRRWFEYTGLAFETPWEQVVHPDDLAQVKRHYEHCVAAGSDFETELRMRCASDGVYRWHLSRAVPIRDAGGAIIRWFGTSTDIDDAKQAAAELQQLNRLLESRVEERSRQLADSELQQRLLLQSVKDYAIVMLDQRGHIVSWNSGAERIYGYTAEEIVGRHASTFDAGQKDGLERVQGWLAIAETDGHFEQEALRVDKHGRTFWANVTLRPVRNEDGSLRGFCKLDRDVNDRKRDEDLIRKRSEEVALANIALSRQTQRAEEANRAKSSFLAAMSHEIRTPMNAILGMADLLWETELSTSQREYVSRFRRAGANLLVLINDILDLSKIESGRFELESVRFDLHELIGRTIELMETRAGAKNIALTAQVLPDTPHFLKGDPGRLQQILNNLIGNALKFTETGNITLAVNPHSDNRPGHVVFAVTDTGIGIPPDKLQAVFEDFTQAESSTTRRFGGTGLGLGICRRLVTHMGGQLSVSSVLGSGSTFTFDVVLVPGEHLGTGHKGAEHKKETIDLAGRRVLVLDGNPGAGVPLKILIAEDAEDNRFLIKAYLRKRPYELSFAVNGREALEAYRRQAFDVVLMDVQMPVMDGLEAAAAIRDLERSNARGRVPILALSANALVEDIERSSAAGCDTHLCKPISKDKLISAIESFRPALPQAPAAQEPAA